MLKEEQRLVEKVKERGNIYVTLHGNYLIKLARVENHKGFLLTRVQAQASAGRQ